MVIIKKLVKFLKSLKFKVLAIILFIGIIPISLILFYYISNFEDKLVQSRIDDLKRVSIITKNTILLDDYLNTHVSVSVDTELAQVSTVFDGRAIIIDNSFKVIKDTYSIDEGNICLSESVIKCIKGQNIIKYSEENKFIEIAVALSHVDNENKNNVIDGVLLMSFSIEDIMIDVQEARFEAQIIMLISFITIGIIAFVIQLFVSKPFVEMENSIDNIKLGQYDRKIQSGGYTELVRIGKSIQHLINRVKELDESRQEFVSNVSHELKTPMTSIKVLADSLLMQENVPIEMYKEFLTDIVAEIDRENTIISDLLNLVKLEKKTESLNIEKINVNEMVELVLKRIKPIAAKRNIELVFESFRPVSAEIDEVKMTMVISNLVENAVKYNVLDGSVRVSLNADHKYFYLKVADTGVGIPEESQKKIFERFYRVDKTRSRETGGTGLGLAITNNAIIMHKGDIKVHSIEEEGTTFTIRIPLVYVP